MMYFIIKYWKGLALAILSTIFLSVAYNQVYSRGYEKASIVYEQKIKEYNDQVAKKITALEKSSDLLLDQNATILMQNSIEFSKLKDSLKGKQLYTIVAGKCSPSKDFTEAWNEAIKKANTK